VLHVLLYSWVDTSIRQRALGSGVHSVEQLGRLERRLAAMNVLSASVLSHRRSWRILAQSCSHWRFSVTAKRVTLPSVACDKDHNDAEVFRQLFAL
jgi:hypothetical protein